jgi:hypothetical protein
MIDCNHIYTLGAERGTSAVLNGKCSICGERAEGLYSVQILDALDADHARGSRASETLQPFDKMQPGEVDKVFRATCPKCDDRVWIFMGTGTGEQALRDINPDARQCENCGYVHWLRGPNTSEVVPLPHHETAKKDRIRSLVHSMLESPCAYLFFGKFDGSTWVIGPAADAVDFAKDLDREIEATK